MTGTASLLHFGSATLDTATETLRDGSGEPVALRPQSMQVLLTLAARSGETVSKDDLIAAVWPDVAVTDDSLVQCVADIRRALGPEGRDALKTVPRKGYRLDAETVEDGAARTPRLLIAAAVAVVACVAVYLFLRAEPEGDDASAPSLSVDVESADADLAGEVRAALSRYDAVQLLDGEGGDYRLVLSATSDGGAIGEFAERDSGAVLFSRPVAPDGAIRLAADIASPLTGAISRQVYDRSRTKPVAALTRAECYAHGYLISGGNLNAKLVLRTLDCLDRILERDPDDARALALKAGIKALQYWWAPGLDGPERSDWTLREPLRDEAVELASRAEGIPGQTESMVQYNLLRAYYAGCLPEAVKLATERGLALNPDDPTMTAVAGNHLAFAGYWDEGEALALRAIGMTPATHEKTWWWSPAKAAWRRGDYELALERTQKAFRESFWVSHLMLAYTYPFLGEDGKAARAVKRILELRPGFTREDAVEAYRRWCFDDEYLERMDRALTKAGLPSRRDRIE